MQPAGGAAVAATDGAAGSEAEAGAAGTEAAGVAAVVCGGPSYVAAVCAEVAGGAAERWEGEDHSGPNTKR